MQRKKLAAPLALGISLAVAACGGSATVTEQSSAPVESSEPAGNSLLTGSVGTVSGEQFDLGSLDGQDAVLWFWAPW